MKTRKAGPWPLESQQIAVDYLDRIRHPDWDAKWDPATPPRPCIACGAERFPGKVCCGVLTPPARRAGPHIPPGWPDTLPGAGAGPVRSVFEGGSHWCPWC